MGCCDLFSGDFSFPIVMSHVWMCNVVQDYLQRINEARGLHVRVSVCVSFCVGGVVGFLFTTREDGKESYHTYNGVTSHMSRSRVTYMRESCLTYKGVMSRMYMSHVSRT